MSELVAKHRNPHCRHLLLSGASALALLSVLSTQAVAGEDIGQFSFELGGQLGLIGGSTTEWFVPAGGEGSSLGNTTPFTIMPSHSWNIDGAIKLQPTGSDLIYRFGVQYGRTATKHKNVFLSTYPSYYGGTAYYTAFVRHREEHVKLDFQVGKDFGLGMFGNNGGTSIFSLGIRYAQYNSRTNIDFYTETKYFASGGNARISRRFMGVGPMISWEASAPLSEDGFSLDWGAEAALLFGRQKVRMIVEYNDGFSYSTFRHRNTTAPEIGGFMALSWRCPDVPAKVSFGYKVDALFNVYDGGFATARDADRVTHGPFIKVGVNVN